MEVRKRTAESIHNGTNPFARLVADLDGEYYLISEAAEITGIPVSTLRKWMKEGKTKAPSRELIQGRVKAYLYTPEDIAELKARRADKPKQNGRTA